MKPEMHPFANESECLQIGELTIENRVDRVSLYGSIDLTLDKVGLEHARRLLAILHQTLNVMEKTNLPDQITVAEPDTVKNPFE